jgi:hypothetical protein
MKLAPAVKADVTLPGKILQGSYISTVVLLLVFAVSASTGRADVIRGDGGTIYAHIVVLDRTVIRYSEGCSGTEERSIPWSDVESVTFEESCGSATVNPAPRCCASTAETALPVCPICTLQRAGVSRGIREPFIWHHGRYRSTHLGQLGCAQMASKQVSRNLVSYQKSSAFLVGPRRHQGRAMEMPISLSGA